MNSYGVRSGRSGFDISAAINSGHGKRSLPYFKNYRTKFSILRTKSPALSNANAG